MVSLSTVYGITIVLGTIAAIGSAFVGSKVYPIQAGGTLEMALAPAAAILPTVTAALKSATPSEQPLSTEVESPPPTQEEQAITEPPVEEAPVEQPVIEEAPVEETTVGGKKVPSWFKRKHWAK